MYMKNVFTEILTNIEIHLMIIKTKIYWNMKKII